MENDLIQILVAFLGTIGFSIFFTIKKVRILVVSVGAALVWIAFLAFYAWTDNKVLALFGAAALASALAEILARIMKSPTTVLLMPMLIPLIPGGNLYYTMFHMVRGNSEEFQKFLQMVLQEAAAIALGIMLVASVVQVINKIRKYRLSLLLPGRTNKSL